MRRTAPTIEQAVSLAMKQPNVTIRVRDTWSATNETCTGADDISPAGHGRHETLVIRHHGTAVLFVDDAETGTTTHLGPRAWGSVSDQGGVNRVLRNLGISLWASRAGGDFRLLTTPEAGRNPAYIGN